MAVYGVPDPVTGDQVMATLELRAGRTFDADEFAAFLDAQRDLGTKWAPRFVRIVDALPEALKALGATAVREVIGTLKT